MRCAVGVPNSSPARRLGLVQCVFCRADLGQGHNVLDDRRRDLVLSDGRLPDGTGMDVCDAATAMGIRSLILTGYAFSLPAGVGQRYEILLKPMRPAELIRTVERALQS